MSQEQNPAEEQDESLSLPILPLRNSVLFPHVVIPLAVGRERSIALIKEAAQADARIAIVTQREADIDDPVEADLYRVGVSARILKVVRISQDNYSVIIQGQERIRLRSVLTTDPYLHGSFEPLPDAFERDVEIDALFATLRTTAKQVVKFIPDPARRFCRGQHGHHN